MPNKGGNRPTLRADKRYLKSAPAKKKPARKPKAKPAAKRKRAARKRPSGLFGWIAAFIRWVMRLVWMVTWRVGAVGGLVLAAAIGYFYTTLPPVSELIDGRTKGSVTLLDRYGDVFAWRGEHFDSIANTSQVSKHLKNAVVATEDKRFYRHLGVSPRGIASAVRINLREGRGPLSGHGGSTLTQQTAKLLCLGVPYDPSVWPTESAYEADCRRTTKTRKIKEAVYAMAMEARYSKDEILTIYLNRAYLGASARGFQAASQRYFGIDALDVSPAQGAMLAGLLVAPTTYAPTGNLQRAQDRADTVIRLMFEQGYLSAAQRDDAWENPATLSSAAEKRAGGYFADWVMDTGPSFLTRDTTEDVILHTTLDQDIQKSAETALAHIFDTKVREGSKAQAAIVVMSADGAVRAMVGGRATKVSGAFNRATMAKRQTGSAFKPFVYAAAMDLGYTPNATVVDEPHCIDVPGSGRYCPENYDRKYAGKITLTRALADSRNIPAVKISEFVERKNVRKIANEFGIASDLADGPALALGASESSLLEMSGAYAGILNGGRSVTPYGLVELRLQGEDDPLMGQGGGYGERVISEQAAKYLVYMMSQVVESGTGARARLSGRPAAGKTGTTQGQRDAWFIGFTADYVAGVWMGYDDNTPLSGVTGGGLPANIWQETMTRVHEGLPVRDLPMTLPQKRVAPRSQGSTQSNRDLRQQQRQQRQAEREQRRQERGDVAERILLDVLNDLFGGNNR